MAKGKVYLVGAGPGNAELITVRGMRLIERADVICYDHLIPVELLRAARADAESIDVGKSAGRHTMPQSEINDLLVRKAGDSEVVVRLKGGDPYLFGRGGEEAAACAKAGVDFEVVPGVSSALAAPAYAGIPLTHRDFTSDVAIITGHRREDTPIEIPKAGTLVFLMSLENLEKVIDALSNAGWSDDTPMAAIERGTCYDQRVIIGKLASFAAKVEQAKLKPPAVIVVGKVVRMRKELDWFSKRPNVLFLGSHPEKYEHLGNIVHRRIIDCVPVEDYTQADEKLRSLGRFDWVVFTSVNGVEYVFERLFAMGLDARTFGSAQAAAIGRTTADRLKQSGIKADIVAVVESSAGLLDEFAKLEMAGKKVLLPRAEHASDEFSERLEKMGARVERIAVYKTVEIDPGDIDFDFIDRVVFTSGSTVRAFVNRYGAAPAGVEAFCLGLPTLREASACGINAQLLPGSPSVKEDE